MNSILRNINGKNIFLLICIVIAVVLSASVVCAVDFDEEAGYSDPVKLEEMDFYVDKSLPESDIKELRDANLVDKKVVKKYTYKTSDSYKLKKIKSKKYKTIYVNKKGLKELKKYKTTNKVYKKIPKYLDWLGYNKKLSKKIYKNEWDVKKYKKIKKIYNWQSCKWKDVKVGTKEVWVTKKIKTYESWIDDDGRLYKSKSWNPYKKYGYNIKYVKSVWRYYSDGDICYDYYKVKVKKPIYKSYCEPVKHKKKMTFYKVKLKLINYKKVKVPHKLTVFTRPHKQPGLIHDYYLEGTHYKDYMYWV